MYGVKRISPRLPYVLAAVLVTTLISWLTGFEQKQNAPLSRIHSSELALAVREFNRSLAEATELRAKRLAQQAKAAKLAASLGATAPDALHARAAADITGVRIEEAKSLAGFARADIRRIILVRVRGPDGAYFFHERGKAFAGARAGEGGWRVRVGNRPLDPKALLICGGGEVVGHVPAGLPGFKPVSFSPAHLWELFPYAIIISLLGFMEAISVAKAMASQTGQRLDPNQELVGQGLANLVGAFFQSYPVSGSFSRSAVNLQSGAVSGVSALFTGLAVLAALLFFTPLLYHLPLSVLAAVIMMAVVGLINPRGMLHAWRAQRYDGVIGLITFTATLGFAPHLDKGIVIGVVLSLGVFLYKSMRPKFVDLAVSRDGALHDADHFGLKRCRHIAMIRFEGPLFFANAAYLEDQIGRHRAAMPQLRHVIIIGEGISELDASGEEALSHIYDRLRQNHIGLSLSGLHWRVMEVLRRTHLLHKIGRENFYPDAASAVKEVYDATHRDSPEGVDCPLLEYCHLDEEEDGDAERK